MIENVFSKTTLHLFLSKNHNILRIQLFVMEIEKKIKK